MYIALTRMLNSIEEAMKTLSLATGPIRLRVFTIKFTVVYRWTHDKAMCAGIKKWAKLVLCHIQHRILY